MATILIRPSYGDRYSPCNLNMCVLKRFMSGQGIPVLFMRRRINGDILMKTEEFPPTSLYSIKQINNVPVEIQLPNKLNYITGIIHHPELVYMDVKEVHELLKDQVYRTSKAPGSNHCLVSWPANKRTELPATVLLGWDRVRVKPLKPRPVRCYHCQAYGHIAADCNRPSVCGVCSGDHEPVQDCQRTPKCPSCSGPHTVFDNKCPVWIEETEVAIIKKQEKKSYRDALKIRQEQKKNEEQDEEDQEEETEDSEDTEEDEDEEEEKEEQAQEDADKEQTRPAQLKRKTTQDEQQEENTTEVPPPKPAKNTGSQQEQSGPLPEGWHQVSSRKKKR